jgi:hypothetical protein
VEREGRVEDDAPTVMRPSPAVEEDPDGARD